MKFKIVKEYKEVRNADNEITKKTMYRLYRYTDDPLWGSNWTSVSRDGYFSSSDFKNFEEAEHYAKEYTLVYQEKNINVE